jgi:hypothetical protein
MVSAIMSVTNNIFGQATPIENNDHLQVLSGVANSALEEMEREATEAEDEHDAPEELLDDLMEEIKRRKSPSTKSSAPIRSKC